MIQWHDVKLQPVFPRHVWSLGNKKQLQLNGSFWYPRRFKRKVYPKARTPVSLLFTPQPEPWKSKLCKPTRKVHALHVHVDISLSMLVHHYTARVVRSAPHPASRLEKQGRGGDKSNEGETSAAEGDGASSPRGGRGRGGGGAAGGRAVERGHDLVEDVDEAVVGAKWTRG